TGKRVTGPRAFPGGDAPGRRRWHNRPQDRRRSRLEPSLSARVVRQRPRTAGPALDRRPPRRIARARARQGRRAPAFRGRLPQHHLSQQDPDHRQRGTELPRRAGVAATLGNRAEDRGAAAGGPDRHQGPGRPGGPARSRRGNRNAAVGFRQARPRGADLPAIPPCARAGAAGHAARRIPRGVFDRRDDHRRFRQRQERAGAGAGFARAPAGRRRRARVHADRAGRDRRHLPRPAARPAGSARPGRAERPRDVRPYGRKAVQIPAPDRAPAAGERRRGSRCDDAPHRRHRLARGDGREGAADHRAGGAGPQPRRAGRGRRAQPHAEIEGAGSGAGVHRPPGPPVATHAMVSKDEETPRPRVIVLSGLSGAGKTVALRAFEDLDFYCVDNLPTALLPSLVAALTGGERAGVARIAVGVDVRSRGDLERLPEALSTLVETGAQVELLFLDSSDEVLLKRYSETRRKHPLSAKRSLPDAIAEERRRLRPLVAIADRVLDTGEMNVHQLRRAIATNFSAADGGTTLLFESFAYRRGLPPDSDFVFDARCLPNPNWD